MGKKNQIHLVLAETLQEQIWILRQFVDDEFQRSQDVEHTALNQVHKHNHRQGSCPFVPCDTGEGILEEHHQQSCSPLEKKVKGHVKDPQQRKQIVIQSCEILQQKRNESSSQAFGACTAPCEQHLDLQVHP